jgi:HSP20 family molecular chaperone IbpA
MKLKDPASRLERIENYCRNLFRITPDHFDPKEYTNDEWVSTPKANIKLSERGYDLEIEVPGFKQDEIKVEIVSGKVKVTAAKKSPEEGENLSKQVEQNGIQF